MAAIFTLRKKERLKQSKLIDELFNQGKSFTVSPYRVQYQFRVLLPGMPLQAGVSVSKRNFKKAVHRNRIKRLMREAFRLQKNGLVTALMQQERQLAVFFIYNGKELPLFATVSDQMNTILNRLIKLVNEKATPNT